MCDPMDFSLEKEMYKLRKSADTTAFFCIIIQKIVIYRTENVCMHVCTVAPTFTDSYYFGNFTDS